MNYNDKAKEYPWFPEQKKWKTPKIHQEETSLKIEVHCSTTGYFTVIKIEEVKA